MKKIFLIEDDPIMSECIIRAAAGHEIRAFDNAISATAALDDGLPDLILLDILLTGPNGFTFLNELNSYSDTMSIPVIIISSLNLSRLDYEEYNIKAVLNKETMTPAEIQAEIRRAI